jgi:glycosyltransferase involved in cell wall biosynthesis
VSVVIPSYNQGRFIGDTIESVLNQDYRAIEVIVIDGGSRDQTLDVLRRYAARISYISEQDRGQSDAINKGFRRARGDIVTWLNSDDLYPDRRAIGVVVDEFAGNPECDLIYGNFMEIDEENRVLRMYRRPGYSHLRLLRIGYISQPATFFRRRVVQKMRVREDLQYAMDLEYWLRAYRMNFRFAHIDFLLAAERLHGDAKCVGRRQEMIAEARSVRADYGAVFNRKHAFRRLVDRALLYTTRLSGISEVVHYRRNLDRLTVPLTFDGVIARTLLFRPLF